MGTQVGRATPADLCRLLSKVVGPLEVVEDEEARPSSEILPQVRRLARLDRPVAGLPDGYAYRVPKDLRVVQREDVGGFLEPHACAVGDEVDDGADVLIGGRIVVRPGGAATDPEPAEGATAERDAREQRVTAVLGNGFLLRRDRAPATCATTTSAHGQRREADDHDRPRHRGAECQSTAETRRRGGLSESSCAVLAGTAEGRLKAAPTFRTSNLQRETLNRT